MGYTVGSSCERENTAIIHYIVDKLYERKCILNSLYEGLKCYVKKIPVCICLRKFRKKFYVFYRPQPPWPRFRCPYMTSLPSTHGSRGFSYRNLYRHRACTDFPPKCCYFVVVGGLACLADPRGYASWSFDSW